MAKHPKRALPASQSAVHRHSGHGFR